MIEREAEKLLSAGVIKEATVQPVFGSWIVVFGPPIQLQRAGYVAQLERTGRAGGGCKLYASLDKAIGACTRMGFGRVSVLTDTASAA